MTKTPKKTTKKRKPGRPRKHPVKDPTVKRGVGRPRTRPIPEPKVEEVEPVAEERTPKDTQFDKVMGKRYNQDKTQVRAVVMTQAASQMADEARKSHVNSKYINKDTTFRPRG